MLNIPQLLAEELSLKPFQVKNALELFAEGATIPFIARYRKERTSEMNEVQLRSLFDQFTYLTEFEERKLVILGGSRCTGIAHLTFTNSHLPLYVSSCCLTQARKDRTIATSPIFLVSSKNRGISLTATGAKVGLFSQS